MEIKKFIGTCWCPLNTLLSNKEKTKELYESIRTKYLSTFFLIIVFSSSEHWTKTEKICSFPCDVGIYLPSLTSYWSVICCCIVMPSTRIQMELMGLITQHSVYCPVWWSCFSRDWLSAPGSRLSRYCCTEIEHFTQWRVLFTPSFSKYQPPPPPPPSHIS